MAGWRIWVRPILLVAGVGCADFSMAQQWSSIIDERPSTSRHSADIAACDCEGCRAYRARIRELSGELPDFCSGDVSSCECSACVARRARLEGLDSFVIIADGSEHASPADGIIQAQAALPSQPLDPSGSLLDSTSGLGVSSLVSTSGDTPSRLPSVLQLDVPTDRSAEAVQAALATPGGSVVSAQTASLLAPAETGTIMRDAGPSNSVTLQRRNTVAYDPHVRGFRYGQILSRVGGVWSPVRQDLDSPISKLDPSLIDDIAIIPGPYASRFGPAFSFIDISTARTPRYQNGSETHGRIGETFRENGGQQHGRASVFGGGSDWGFIGHYGSRTGSDYQSGNNTLIPSSYNNQSFLGQVGFDLTPDSSLEVRYDRLDQTDTEYALQFFDIDYLGNDSSGVRYVDANRRGFFSQVEFDGWYNRTRYHGDNFNASKQPVVQRVEAAIGPGTDFAGTTFGDRMLTGGRVMGTVGSFDDVYSRIGADYRYEDQFIQENFNITQGMSSLPFVTNLPKAWMHDTGVFDELTVPVSSYWTTTVGARVDFVSSDVRAGDVRPNGTLVNDDLSQAETLYGFYLINDIQLTESWGTRVGFGHAQRPPSLVERYADGVFLGIIQSGFSRVIGTPELDKERLWQVDWSLSADYDDVRGRGTVYNSWVHDFATYSGNLIPTPEGARLLTSINTRQATFGGFELYGEGDMTENVTLFSGMNYVQGTDQAIDAPMWGVAPLMGRAGVRLHDANRGETWGAELGLRMVSRQDRAGLIRITGDPAGGLVAIEEPTPGFSVVDLRSYYNVTRNVSFVTGVENLLDKNYLEHLDLRLPAAPVAGLPAIAASSPGITFYAGLEITH